MVGRYGETVMAGNSRFIAETVWQLRPCTWNGSEKIDAFVISHLGINIGA
jgi:hypothetical protein